MIPYLAPKEAARAETEIKKSRFIADIFPVSDAAEAEAAWARVRKEFYDATHHCFACRIGTGLPYEKSSDDGEPQGTAGHPMLHVLRAKDITNVCVIVTRYFGGIKLGTGGLSRAYAGSVSELLETAPLLRYVPHMRAHLSVPYDLVGLFENTIKDTDVIVASRNFAETADMICLVPTPSAETVRRNLTDLSAARIAWEDIGEEYVPLEVET